MEKCLNRLEKRQRTSDRNGNGNEGEEDDDDDDGDEESIDIVGGEDEGDVYEWAGQTRIRASSLLQGGYAIAGTTTTITSAENDEDLNVDGDDTQIYGQSQYSEKDVIPPAQSSEEEYLRSLIAGDSPSKAAGAASSSSDRNQATGSQAEANDSDGSSDSNRDLVASPLSMHGQILESLKARLKEYEDQTSQRDLTKCHICMDFYKDPCVSICCWHVHCEECWMRSLGSRKLCPKCNMITSATDLRRIYL